MASALGVQGHAVVPNRMNGLPFVLAKIAAVLTVKFVFLTSGLFVAVSY
jgi:hypothetical protein